MPACPPASKHEGWDDGLPSFELTVCRAVSHVSHQEGWRFRSENTAATATNSLVSWSHA